MRETQFIGLNKLADIFVQDAVAKKEYKGHTLGMFGEELPLGQWVKNGHTYTEVLQCAPWSSGPMIFTCLKDEQGIELFAWTFDETLSTETVDYATGSYHV